MPRSRVLAALIALAAPAGAEEVDVVTWGGAYEAAQRAAVFAPVEAETGLRVRVRRYEGGVEALAARAGPEGWDVVDMLESDAIAACEAGLLARIDHAALLGEARADFAAPLRPCSVPQNVFATVMAYDDRAFPGRKPTRVEDFFDLARFPGPRAIEKRPDAILEWALMAEGVPPAQVYDLLSTARGLDLAFARLDRIRGAILWWDDPAEAAEMLSDGRAAMASGYNGRFFAAAMEGAPVVTLWDGRLLGTEVWAIPAAADAPAAARRFVARAVRPEAMARLATRIPYGPARRSAFSRIGLHPAHGVPMRAYLPNAPHRGRRSLERDSRWYARTRALRARRFEAWLGRGGGGAGAAR
jgi:putative spermidine/putrescine transport system substrate-binding protein